MPGFLPKNADFEAVVRDSFGRQSFMAMLGARLTRLAPGAVDHDHPAALAGDWDSRMKYGGGRMWKREAAVIVLSLVCTVAAGAQELHAGIGYARIFGAGGFSLATGYLHTLGDATAPARQRIGGDFWYANTDVATQPAGNAGRNVVGLGARYEVELTRCCGRVHPLAALPVQVIHSSVSDPTGLQSGAAAIELVPTPAAPLPAEDRSGSAWGWGAGLELGVRLEVGPQWTLRTSGTAIYQDVYAGSATNGAWAWHLGVGYRFGS